MIYGFLIGYSLVLTLILGWAIYRVYNRKPKPEEKKDEDAELKRFFEQFLGEMGIKNFKIDSIEMVKPGGRLPQSNVEWRKQLEEWMHIQFDAIRYPMTDMKRDVEAILTSSETMVKTMIELRDKASAVPDRGPEAFANIVKLARDKYATTETQKNVLNKVISNIMSSETAHG